METPAPDQQRKRSRLHRRGLLALAVLTLAIVCVFALGPRDREPTCNGKPLSQWVMTRTARVAVRHRNSHIEESVWTDIATTQRLANAEAAIRHIGTNGLPFLLDWLAHENSAPRLTWRQKVIDLVTKIPMPKKFQAGLRNTPFNAYPEQRPRPAPEDALWCFRVLGSNAAPAIPQLVKMAAQRDNWQASVRAVEVLGGIGADSLPTLLDLSTNYACPSRRHVIITLVQFAQTNDSADMQVISRTIVRCVKDGDIGVARQAVRSLGELKIDPTIAFPVLTNGLLDQNLAYACVESLGKYGGAAQPALPSLLALMTNADQELRNSASNSVVQINPEAFALPEK